MIANAKTFACDFDDLQPELLECDHSVLSFFRHALPAKTWVISGAIQNET